MYSIIRYLVEKDIVFRLKYKDKASVSIMQFFIFPADYCITKVLMSNIFFRNDIKL